jgi:hypothetical protein
MRASRSAGSFPRNKRHRGGSDAESSKGDGERARRARRIRSPLREIDGGYTAAFERYTADADPAEFFRGLPGDRCQCAHWGYILSGRITFRYGDHEETYEAGDAYYAPPGHTPVVFAGTELVEFSPTDSHDETTAVIVENMRAVGLVP